MARRSAWRVLGRAAATAVASCVALAIPSRMASQVPPARGDTASEETKLRVARDIMRVARFGALVTRDLTGGSSARTIDPLPPDSSFVVRFATNPRSRKLREIARDRRVTLFYFDPATQGYV